MADFTKTISNIINVFGGSPPTYWGDTGPNTMVWGETNWGEGTYSMAFKIGKCINNTQAMTTTIGKQAKKGIVNTIPISDETIDRTLQDPEGYNYVFPGNVTDAENEVFTSYTIVTATDGWTEVTQTTTSWST